MLCSLDNPMGRGLGGAELENDVLKGQTGGLGPRLGEL